MAAQAGRRLPQFPNLGKTGRAPSDLAAPRAAGRARLRLTSRKNDKAAIQEGKFSASQSIEIARNRERISETSTARISPPRSYGEGRVGLSVVQPG
jgi:hypothetical protein